MDIIAHLAVIKTSSMKSDTYNTKYDTKYLDIVLKVRYAYVKQ